MRRWSPYNYSFNSPIIFIDPDGMEPAGTDILHEVLEAYVGADNRPGMQPLNNKSSDEEVINFNKNAHDAALK